MYEKQKLSDEEKKTLAEEYRKTMEAKLKRSEKDLWFIPNHDHLIEK